jgi:hypothetical protein
VWGPEEYLRGLWTGSIVVETPTLTRRPGVAPFLRVRNVSAIPMHVVVRGAPEWMIFSSPLTLDAESVSFVRPPLTAAAPAGEHQVELTLEVSNLHTAPGQNLTVKWPLTVRIGP